MGKKVRKKTDFTKLIIWIAVGTIGAALLVYYNGNYALAVLVASLAFAIGLASMVKRKKR